VRGLTIRNGRGHGIEIAAAAALVQGVSIVGVRAGAGIRVLAGAGHRLLSNETHAAARGIHFEAAAAGSVITTGASGSSPAPPG